jgi:uncharacterized protein YjbJ (UPF0337 family)
VTKDDPNRSEGSWNQTVGSVKEAAGGLVGSEVSLLLPAPAACHLPTRPTANTDYSLITQSLKQSGRQQNLEGQQQEAAGQVSDFASGVGNRVSGAVGGAVADITGDRSAQAEYQQQHDVGKTQQRGAEYDIQKQADATANSNPSSNN